ncbi:hypothetical protein BDZ90DRAFT_233723 [Jaminaea rosea]|uniref:Uncharacterized protein n=1 Tax=Jaminaea rosea TaxID=1569628 RepID=A0A316UL98_9BASI|nr:hypothetical protein BDZ90DRAFT_233723 [Jaminaea rosea]PWN25714.1 hypothetical protein BDZ90DRAFT_233723 [Jaminaea rosea]
MATRLDRLVSLLDTGSTPAIKGTAARQLGQIANQRVRGGANQPQPPPPQQTQHQHTSSAPSSSASSPAPTNGHTHAPASSSSSHTYHGSKGQWDEALHLCSRVVPFLHSRSWDTREAAALAIESICRGAGVWSADDDVNTEQDGSTSRIKSEQDGEALAPMSQDDLATLEDFQLDRVLSNGVKLLSSAGKEYNIFTSGGNVADHLAQAKADMAKMGLGGLGGVEMDLGLDFEAELKQGATASSHGFKTSPPAASPKLPPPKFAPQPAGTSISRFAGSPGAVKQESTPGIKQEPTPGVKSPSSSGPRSPADPEPPEIDMSKLSARERNQLKRKRKLEGKSGDTPKDEKTRVVDGDDAQSLSQATGLRLKTPATSSSNSGGDYFGSAATKAGATSTPAAFAGTAAHVSLVAPAGEWPFTHLTSVLLADLFSAKWEVRHGACLALRSIFSVQGHGGGMSLLAASATSNRQRKAKWAEDAAVKLLCLLCLDRLSDFVFDQVVAPVREVGAQALSALLPHLSADSRSCVREQLMAMTKQAVYLPPNSGREHAQRGDAGYAWEVRHAGLSGLRWLVEADTAAGTASQDALTSVSSIAVACLRDSDDDIRAAASAVLLPLASDVLVSDLSAMLPSLLQTLWDCLGEVKDDLNSSTGSVMDLLARLVKHQAVREMLHAKSAKPLSALIPLIYPFFRHTITSVRLSVVRTLRVFLDGQSAPKAWLDERVFRLLFQNLIVEEKMQIRDETTAAWHSAVTSVETARLHELLRPHLGHFATILMTPLGVAFDFSLFYDASRPTASQGEARYNVDKSILAQDLSLVGVDTVIRGRLGATHALGQLFARLPADDALPLVSYLDSQSALQKCLAAYVVQEWASISPDVATTSEVGKSLSTRLLAIIEGPPPPTWSEMAVQLSRIQLDCQSLYKAFMSEGKVSKAKIPELPTGVDPTGERKDAFTAETAERVVTRDYEALLGAVGPKIRKTATPVLEDRRRKIIASIGFYRDAKDKQDTQVMAAVSAAVISLKTLPAKLNPLIRSIMNSVKFEDNADLQARSAKAVADFVAHCRRPGSHADPSSKIIKNLCAFVCQDTTQTAVFASHKSVEEGIMSHAQEVSLPARGGKAVAEAMESEETRQGKLIRRGAEVTLQEMASRFGQELFSIAPALWEGMTATLKEVFAQGSASADEILSKEEARGQGVLDCCTLVATVSSRLSSTHDDRIESLLPLLTAALQSKLAVIRSAAARCLSSLADSMTLPTMIHVVRNALPLLGDSRSVTNRQGAIEVLSQIVTRLDIKLLPYIIVLVVPVLGRMSDSDEAVRLAATSTFAALIKMVPLEAGLTDPSGFPEDLLRRRDEERTFLSQLLDGSKVEPYQLPVKINADLRKYQREGVSWMHFLSKFQLHGVLCDDMGLGKTLQSICILAAKHHERDERYKATQAPDSAPLPSLVICPPTLTGHWVHEIQQYSTNLKPLLYGGGPSERAATCKQIARHDVVVMSYDVVRNDIAALSSLNWSYCILDEGHIIKNAKTKTTKAVKQIKANHRLILTGTPIQNNVLELWSLFDFLMPGFLGTERAFHERFGKPIVATREGKASAKEQEAAALALESLHKQVLPFLLRRLKDDVLDDLPPKIIQDVECELGVIQKKLYDEHARAENGEGDAVDEALQETAAPQQPHVFQTLQYLRKLVNHPALVYDPAKQSHLDIVDDELRRTKSTLRDIRHAPKLATLMQLLQSCGIGKIGDPSEVAAEPDAPGEVSSPHRVLIFCQMKQMLDIIEKDLFAPHMPSVSYMRLDGSVPAEKRQGIVTTFNADPSIDVLLLTTSVGGLGLTLTGADTVIFVEHDWNPMRDLQAMDRAHRLGQRKVVNVYRLITRDTLEARIMGLQQFKLNVANTVVGQQNKDLESMATDQVLDLFGGAGGGGAGGKKEQAQSLLEQAAAAAGGKRGGISQKALLANLEAMGDTGDDYAGMNEWRPS